LNFGMLYPRGASKTLRFHLSFESSHGYHIDVYDAYIYTSSNNSNHIYLNGYYFVVRDYGPDVFQIRTHNGSYFRPKLKKLSNMTDMRVYVPEEKDSIDPKYIKFYQRIKEEFRSPSMVLGGNGNDLHIGVTLRPMRRTLKELNDRSYLQLRNSLVQLVDLANIIDNKDDSDNEW